MTFLAGSKVSMADGSLKNIEDLEIGDEVLDYQFNTRTIDGIKNGRYCFGLKLIKINNKIFNTSCHMFYGADGNFYDYKEDNGRNSSNDFKNFSYYMTKNNIITCLWQWGLDSNLNLLKEICIGAPLLTIDGAEIVTSIELLDPKQYENETLYMHSVSGTGSYFVDGYCVSARMNEFWDYKNHKPYDESFAIIGHFDPVRNIVYAERHFNLDVNESSYRFWDYKDNDWNPSIVNGTR